LPAKLQDGDIVEFELVVKRLQECLPLIHLLREQLHLNPTFDLGLSEFVYPLIDF